MSEQDKSVKIAHTKWLVGSHIQFNMKIIDSVEFALSHGMYSLQFFMGSPTGYDRQKISDDDITSVISLTKIYPMNIFSHFPFIANLNGKVDSLAWSGDIQVDTRLLHVMSQLEYELSVIAKFNNKHQKSGVVIHPGCYPDRDIGHATVAKTINELKFAKNSMLLLENCAGEGRKLCRTFLEINQILSLLKPEIRRHVAVCVDTAHIWGQGDYDISTIQGVQEMFRDFDEIIGSDKFYLLHLNDSQVPFGAKKDRHEFIGCGYIWSENIDSLVYLLNECDKRGIPMVLETEYTDMKTIFKLTEMFT
jgi:deoxyribonuclease-4